MKKYKIKPLVWEFDDYGEMYALTAFGEASVSSWNFKEYKTTGGGPLNFEQVKKDIERKHKEFLLKFIEL